MSLQQFDSRQCSDPCPGPCAGCPDRIVCHCLKVAEGQIVDAVVSLGLRTVKEGGGSDAERLRFAFRSCVARKPNEKETTALLDLLKKLDEGV